MFATGLPGEPDHLFFLGYYTRHTHTVRWTNRIAYEYLVPGFEGLILSIRRPSIGHRIMVLPFPSDCVPAVLKNKIFLFLPRIPAVCVKKIFNGYFLIAVKHPPSSHRRRNRDSNPPIAVQNINPADPLRYTCYYRSDSPRKDITIIVSIIEALNNSWKIYTLFLYFNAESTWFFKTTFYKSS